MTSRNDYIHNNRSYFILLRQKGGTKKELSYSNVDKDCVVPVSAGTLLEFIENIPQVTQDNISRFKTCDALNIFLVCRHSQGEFEEIDAITNCLLMPIHSPKERLQVFKDKSLLNDGKILKENDSVFVRLKSGHTELEGIICYKGPIDESGGIYFGLKLREKKGQSDGSHLGRHFFHTDPGHAVFVPLHKVRRNREDWQKSDLMRLGDVNVNGDLKSSHGQSKSIPNIDLKIGDRIVWPSDHGYERGTVQWIGVLPDEPSGSPTVGVDFDNPVGTGTGKYKLQRLFYTRQGHASLIPPMGLIKENECDQSLINPILNEQETLLNNYSKNKAQSQQFGSSHQKTASDMKKNSLPTQFNHYTGFIEPVAGLNGTIPPTGEENQNQVTTGKAPGSANRHQPDLSLTVGSMVEVQSRTPLYGVIQWIGYTEANPTKLTAGLELEEETTYGTDGIFGNMRYFSCKPGKALFVPLSRCVKDKRFLTEESPGGFGGISSPDVPGDIPVPDVLSNSDLRLICGKNRGIQGHHNSCYLDTTLFCMFYFSTVFDSIFNRPPKENDLPEYPEVQTVLKEGIVNPLRKHKYVAADKVWKLRRLLDKLGTVPGMMGEEKDVEEFLNALLTEIMKADPLLHLSTGEHAYFYQLFIEKDENLVLPTTQRLVDLSFLQGNVKLEQAPACLMIQMPRFGKDYKMFRRIVPSLQLDITDILGKSPRDCIVCGDLATWECKMCFQIHGPGLNTTAFCEKCKIMSHQHATRKNHQPETISTGTYFGHFQKKKEEARERKEKNKLDGSDMLTVPREKMELFAVICIQTSHYVSFVKCGLGINAPWVFFDSMADRIGEQGGYNIPEVVHVPNIATWLSENNFNHLNQIEDKDLPEHLRRILCDGYMCMYQNPDVMMFQ